MRRGLGLPGLGGFNRAVVLDAIRHAPDGISRVELAETTGLSPQTVTNLCRRLLDAGLIREAGTRIAGPGKPRTMLELVPRGGFAVGVHLDPSFITSVVVDLDAVVVARAHIRTPDTATPAQVVDGMERSILGLLADPAVDPDRVFGIGLASPGPLDRDRGIVAPPLLSGWREVPLRDALIERLGRPVALEKDVTAAAVGDVWSKRSTAASDFAFLYYGTGIGLGIVSGGVPLLGASANVGDVGHLLVRGDGRRCSCGRRGCLGDSTSPANAVREAADAGILELPAPPSALEVDEAFTRLCALAADGEPTAAAIVRQIAADLGVAIATVANLLDVTEVICGGPFWDRLAAVALDDLRADVAASPVLVTPHPIGVLSSGLGVDVTAIGAACQVLDAVLSPRSATLLVEPPGRTSPRAAVSGR